MIAIAATTVTISDRMRLRAAEPSNGHFHHTRGITAAKNGSVASSKGDLPLLSKALTRQPGSITAHANKRHVSAATNTAGPKSHPCLFFNRDAISFSFIFRLHRTLIFPDAVLGKGVSLKIILSMR